MGALDLAGRMTLNSSGWDQTVNRASASMDKFADKVENKLGRKLNKLIGYGAVASLLYKPFSAIMDAFTTGPHEMGKKISEESEKAGLSPEYFQMAEAAAKSMGITVDEWMDKMRKGRKTVAEVTAELENFRSAVKLTDDQVSELSGSGDYWSGWKDWAAQKTANAGTWLTDLFARLQLQYGGMSEEDARAGIARDNAQQLLNRKSDANAKLAQTLAKKQPFRPEFGVNEWQRVGEYVGGGSDAVVDRLSRIADSSSKTESACQRTAAALEALKNSGGLYRGSGAGGEW